MPQASPMSWMVLYLFFLFIYFMVVLMVHYFVVVDVNLKEGAEGMNISWLW